MSAPASNKVTITAGSELSAAAECRGVRERSSRALGLAPARSNSAITSGLASAAFLAALMPFGISPGLVTSAVVWGWRWRPAAKCKGVWPYSSRALRQAPVLTSLAMIAGLSVEKEAWCSGVWLWLPRTLGSSPASTQVVTSSIDAAAKISWYSSLHNLGPRLLPRRRPVGLRSLPIRQPESKRPGECRPMRVSWLLGKPVGHLRHDAVARIQTR